MSIAQAEVWQNFLTAYQRTQTSWTYQIIRYPHFKGALFHSVKKKRISPISQIRIVHTQITSLEALKSNKDVYIHLKFLDASNNRIQTMGDLLSSSFLLEPIHLDLRNNDMTTVCAKIKECTLFLELPCLIQENPCLNLILWPKEVQ